MPDRSLVRVPGRCFLASEPAVEQIVARGSGMLGRRWRWLRPLAQRYIKVFIGRTRPRQREVARFLVHDRGFQRACGKYSHELSVEKWLAGAERMLPDGGGGTWGVARIEAGGGPAGGVWGEGGG